MLELVLVLVLVLGSGGGYKDFVAGDVLVGRGRRGGSSCFPFGRLIGGGGETGEEAHFGFGAQRPLQIRQLAATNPLQWAAQEMEPVSLPLWRRQLSRLGCE